MLKPKEIDSIIEVLANDTIHSSENFDHTSSLRATESSGFGFGTIGGPADEFLFWLKKLSGTSTFVSEEDGAESAVTFENFVFQSDLGLRAYTGGSCSAVVPPETPDLMRWGKWGGGKITIENDYGTSVFENVSYYAGIIINHSAQYATFGKATGIFLNSDATLQIAMPDYPGIAAGEDWVWEQTIEGNGLLVFSLPPRVAIESEPTEGDAVVDGPSIEYTPDLGSEGDDEFSYSVMTQLGDSDEALVSVSTIDLDVHDNYGNLLSEIVEDSPGANVFINTDDDNENQVPDVLESGLYDDDLVRLEIKDLGMQGGEGSEVFSLAFDPLIVSIWRSSDKTSDDPLLAAKVEPNEVLTGERIFWIEGLAIGATQIALSWAASQGIAATVFDAVLVNVIPMQSNNAPKISPDPEELSVWENYIGDSAANYPDGWKKVDPNLEGRLWEHNQHAWRIQFAQFPELSQVTKYEIWALPFASRNPHLENVEFTVDPGVQFGAVNGLRFIESPEPIFGQPPFRVGDDHVVLRGKPPELGDFVYVAVVSLADGKFRTSKAIAMPFSKATIEYTKDLVSPPSAAFVNIHYKPEGTHQKNVQPGDVIYPERKLHNESGVVWNQLGVLVTVIPKVSRPLIAPLYIQVFDPDNSLPFASGPDGKADSFDGNDEAPIETNPGDNLKPHDQHTLTKGKGRYIIGAKLKEMLASSIGTVELELKLSGATPANFNAERVHRILEIDNGQPGNNWQVGLHDEKRIVNEYSYEKTKTLSGDGKNLRTGGIAPEYVPENLKTKILTAVRTLWVESGYMGDPNKVSGAARGVFDGEAGCNGCDDPIAFQKQTDISVLKMLLEPYLVDVELIPGAANPRQEIGFLHTAGEPQNMGSRGDEIRDVRSVKDHWVVHVIHAYETYRDNDPNFQPLTQYDWDSWNSNWILGYATGIVTDQPDSGDGNNWIYEEEIRDVFANTVARPAKPFRLNPRGIVTAHEILHRFFGPHGSNGDVNKTGIMDWGVAFFQRNAEDVLKLTGLQVQYVQARERPV